MDDTLNSEALTEAQPSSADDSFVDEDALLASPDPAGNNGEEDAVVGEADLITEMPENLNENTLVSLSPKPNVDHSAQGEIRTDSDSGVPKTGASEKSKNDEGTLAQDVPVEKPAADCAITSVDDVDKSAFESGNFSQELDKLLNDEPYSKNENSRNLNKAVKSTENKDDAIVPVVSPGGAKTVSEPDVNKSDKSPSSEVEMNTEATEMDQSTISPDTVNTGSIAQVEQSINSPSSEVVMNTEAPEMDQSTESTISPDTVNTGSIAQVEQSVNSSSSEMAMDIDVPEMGSLISSNRAEIISMPHVEQSKSSSEVAIMDIDIPEIDQSLISLGRAKTGSVPSVEHSVNSSSSEMVIMDIDKPEIEQSLISLDRAKIGSVPHVEQSVKSSSEMEVPGMDQSVISSERANAGSVSVMKQSESLSSKLTKNIERLEMNQSFTSLTNGEIGDAIENPISPESDLEMPEVLQHSKPSMDIDHEIPENARSESLLNRTTASKGSLLEPTVVPPTANVVNLSRKMNQKLRMKDQSAKVTPSASTLTNIQNLQKIPQIFDLSYSTSPLSRKGLKRTTGRSDKQSHGARQKTTAKESAENVRPRKSKKRKAPPSGKIESQIDCINILCESGLNLMPAQVAIMSYYGVRRDRNVIQKVCEACAAVAEKHYRKLKDMLENKIPLLHAEFPPPVDDVVVMDKVEEICDCDEPLPPDVIKMVEENMEDGIYKVLQKCDADFQIKESLSILESKCNKLSDSFSAVNGQLDAWDREMAEMVARLYKNYTPCIQELPAVDLTDHDAEFELLVPLSQCPYRLLDKPDQMAKCILPPPPPLPFPVAVRVDAKEIEAIQEIPNTVPQRSEGVISYPPLEKYTQVYILKGVAFGPWYKGKIIDIARRPDWNTNTPGAQKWLAGQAGVYNVRFDDIRHGMARVVGGKSLAYTEPSNVSYPVGTRIIARYRVPDDHRAVQDAYYTGVIAEPEKQINRFRYLVFFEHGFAHYVHHDWILPVCEVSKDVWDDVDKECKEFVQSYLLQYPERPMVRLQVGQCVKTEWNKRWWHTKVLEVDSSMAHMHYEHLNRNEWIYRGSTRLRPLYSKLVQKQRSFETSFLKKRNMPYVEYNVVQPVEEHQLSRNVAKKGTGAYSTTVQRSPVPRPVAVTSNVPPRMLDRMEYPTKGYVRAMDLSQRIRNRPFEPHICGVGCVNWTRYQEADYRSIPPLVVPLTVGFSRLVHKTKGKRSVAYLGPCGRRLRNMAELRSYLQRTQYQFGVDYFDFDHWVKVTDEFHLDESMYKFQIEDISDGVESMAVPCVNEINDLEPQVMTYLTQRLPQEGVNLNTDPQFMICCDCTDDCSRKNNCACWNLTKMAGTVQGAPIDELAVGYQFRRLPEPVTTGIYECHSGCKCKSTCLNRVVQHPLTQRLQVFRTLHKGWGVRTLNDIPTGAFICIYVGRLHTEAKANEDGRMYGDEYLAELDYIEVVEQFKEGFESDAEETVSDKESEGDSDGSSVDDSRRTDKEYVPEVFVGDRGGRDVQTRLRGQRTPNSSQVNSNEPELVDLEAEEIATSSKFTPNVDDIDNNRRGRKSVRELFGDGANEVYIMDAKVEGNLGRYLNHSCQPNVFVQNVFVDTHDIRFPWIAFFAMSHIRAGTELTWDYNYNIGSVRDKVLYCYCGTGECRGRLL